ncbi:MAG: 30S ribosomal protein S24e [Candidatus Micrarchaeaceae archaeon]|jgi:ribosomal protein S24E|nr:30S ribosomal protein S24e [Candidatus Micrarchaeota archaeon]
MELKILSNNENKLLKRKEISFSVVQEGGTVNKAELSKELCKKLNLHPESTIITRIDQGYGMKGSTGMAHAYQTKEELEKYEPRKLLERGAKKAAKAQPAEAKAEEKTE